VTMSDDDDAIEFGMEDGRRIGKAVRWSEGFIRGNEFDGGANRQHDPTNWLPFVNNQGSSIPPYSVIDTTSGFQMAGEEEVFFGTQPGTTFSKSYAVTWGSDSPSPDGGMLTFEGPVRVAYDTGTPAMGECWGPKNGQFTVSKGYPGFEVVGVVDSGNKIVLVKLAPITSLLAKTTGLMVKRCFADCQHLGRGWWLGNGQ
jgi:hypothetical protein